MDGRWTSQTVLLNKAIAGAVELDTKHAERRLQTGRRTDAGRCSDTVTVPVHASAVAAKAYSESNPIPKTAV
ncbi:MAG: hypothetical protein ACLUOF_12465 [Ruminococcus sp.]